MVYIITSKSRNKWRSNPNAKYRNATTEEVCQRAKEVIAAGGTVQDAQNAVRELTMNNTSTARCWENFAAGVAAANEAATEKMMPHKVEEADVTVVDTPTGESDG